MFVQGTYFLEGDGLTIMYTYDFIKHIEQVIHNDHFPVLDEYIDTFVSDIEDLNERDIERDILKGHALDVLKPGHAYFARNVLNGDVCKVIRASKSVRITLQTQSCIKRIIYTGANLNGQLSFVCTQHK